MSMGEVLEAIVHPELGSLCCRKAEGKRHTSVRHH